MKNKRFHHGNLREELLRVATQTLNEKGMEGLSLRGIAQALNVSSAAPFRHFKNKEALITALVEKEGAKMTKAYEEAVNSDQPDEKCLSQACMTYLLFAEKKPNVFKLIFSDRDHFFELGNDSTAEQYSYQLFERLVTVLIPSDVPESQFRQVAVSCWALLHGFATLHMTGRLETVDYQKEQAIRAVIALAKSPNNAYP